MKFDFLGNLNVFEFIHHLIIETIELAAQMNYFPFDTRFSINSIHQHSNFQQIYRSFNYKKKK